MELSPDTDQEDTHVKIRHLVPALAACALLATACTTDDPKPTGAPPVMPPASSTTTTAAAGSSGSSTPGVYAPTEVGVSKSTGVEVSILSVEDANSRYGPVTVFTFQLNNAGSKVFDGYNFPTPTLVYGAAGSPAEHTVSISEGYGDGVKGAVPPGSRQTVKYAYAVQKSQLNPAVVTAGSIIWQGDFSTFQR